MRRGTKKKRKQNLNQKKNMNLPNIEKTVKMNGKKMHTKRVVNLQTKKRIEANMTMIANVNVKMNMNVTVNINENVKMNLNVKVNMNECELGRECHNIPEEECGLLTR
jgi:hypothetical protein